MAKMWLYPVCSLTFASQYEGAFIFAWEPVFPGANSILTNSSKGSWRGACSPSLELREGRSLECSHLPLSIT